MTLSQILIRSGDGEELEPAKFRSKETGVGAVKGKWPDSEPELKSLKTLLRSRSRSH